MENASEELGRIEKPSVSDFEGGRKLFFVPLVLLPPGSEDDLKTIVDRYWEQADSHVANLEAKLGQVVKVYHELVTVVGDEGVKAIEELDVGSYQIIKSRTDGGAELQPVEDAQLLWEFMDWNRCLAVGLQSQKAFTLVYESYTDAHKKRNEHIAQQLDETLQEGEIGILLMREGHQVQFPSSIQVFYVAPPALDEMKRWIRSRNAEGQTKAAEEPEEPEKSED
jgi:hypothetical protein